MGAFVQEVSNAAFGFANARLAPSYAAAQVDPADGQKAAMDVMDDGPSLILFLGAVVIMALVAVVALPPLFDRLTLNRAIAGLALVGPAMGLAGTIIGTGAMTLSGHDFWYSLIVAAAAGLASIIVGLRLARPVARDLSVIADTVEAVAAGDRVIRTNVERSDEIGSLAIAVDGLSASLDRSEKVQRAAENERNAVVSALSHDLRTPLASLLVSVDAVQDGIGDAASHLRAMRGNVIALERLVSDLFLLAKADSGRLQMTSEPLDLSELFDEALDAVRPVAEKKGVHLVASSNVAIAVVGDHTALGRVLRNLLDNAIRYSPNGGRVGIQHRLEASSVRFAVVDEGEGFEADFIPRALDRFSQADKARSGNETAGLGLALVSAMVKAHGGEVSIRPGPGGWVEVRLPLDLRNVGASASSLAGS